MNKNWVLHACSAHVASATSMWNMHQLTRTNNACKLHVFLLKSSQSLPFPVVLAKCAYDKSQTKYSTQKTLSSEKTLKNPRRIPDNVCVLSVTEQVSECNINTERLFLFRLLMSTIHTRWLSFLTPFSSTFFTSLVSTYVVCERLLWCTSRFLAEQ